MLGSDIIIIILCKYNYNFHFLVENKVAAIPRQDRQHEMILCKGKDICV